MSFHSLNKILDGAELRQFQQLTEDEVGSDFLLLINESHFSSVKVSHRLEDLLPQVGLHQLHIQTLLLDVF